ncbi:MAG: MoxR family ATPase [Alkalinema sp. RU_4_3]|nr:MoxR family ATPase [Alkalinema sp. RU_4_3]
MNNEYWFENQPSRRPEGAHKDSPMAAEPYVIADDDAGRELKQAVNLAIHLQRPLLLEGEAGCGKTRLATAVAYELGLPLYRWNVRSTSKVDEGLYEFDALLRLYDVQVPGLDRQPENPMDYVRFGPLGEAFDVSRQIKKRAVVLIDEIDKADLDFPNDLLTVLDRPWEFRIREKKGEMVRTEHPPIVVITSNREKRDLPEAFLRRCVYFYLEFPEPETLHRIVEMHYGLRSEPISEGMMTLVDRSAARLVELRKLEPSKKPGTSEFLDWIEAMRVSVVEGRRSIADLIGQIELDKNDKRVPFREVLFKVQRDWQEFGTFPL